MEWWPDLVVALLSAVLAWLTGQWQGRRAERKRRT